jgi:hypothetical protein
VLPLRDLKSLRLRQLRLSLIEGPKAPRFEFERARHMQAVERSDAEFWAVLAMMNIQVNREGENKRRKLALRPVLDS